MVATCADVAIWWGTIAPADLGVVCPGVSGIMTSPVFVDLCVSVVDFRYVVGAWEARSMFNCRDVYVSGEDK